jgi:SNF2 family DNA or RNA helicase
MELFLHQKEALKQTEGFQNIAFYHGMGLGKTYTGSEAMSRFGNRVNLVICQKSKVQDWTKHLTNNYNTVAVFDLTDKKQFSCFTNWITAPQDAPASTVCCVGVINYELAWRRKQLKDLKDFTLMLDESSLIQNPKAKQTKFIMSLKPSHVILLSGTPVGGKYENLWTQCRLLGWKISQDIYDETYVNWDKIEVQGIPHRIVRKEDPYKNVDRLKRKLKSHGAVFLKTEEALDLPSQRFQVVRVDSSADYRKFVRYGSVVIHTGVYDHLIDGEWDGKTYDDLHELTADSSLTKLLYARQLCGLYSKDKQQAVRDLIQSTQDRLIVFYNFNGELEKLKKICQEEHRPVSEINGHNKDLTAYQEESNSVTLVQYQSGSMGLNLQEANKMIFYSLPLSSEHFEQAKKRIHRIGQEKTCFYYILICRNSVEEQILQTLEERKDFTDELFKI